jgi:hypothetical protein
MGIRETLNRRPGATTGIAAGVLVIAVAAIVWQTAGGGAPAVTARGFYTADDGKTWFTDDIHKPTPFDQGGQPAYGAIVVRCAGAEPHVDYMTRLANSFLNEAKALNNKEPDFGLRFQALQMQGTEVRKPGEKAWHRLDSPEGQRVVEGTMKCPDGSAPEPVIP